MPELPEAETVRRILLLKILNQKIEKTEVIYAKTIRNKTKDEFMKELTGDAFIDIKRKGKYLLFELMKHYLLVHLRMEGKFRYEKTSIPGKHDCVVFHFKTHSLCYNDTRKFGTMHLFAKDEDPNDVYPLKRVAFDILSPRFKSEQLEKYTKSTSSVKTLLLRQDIISGIGNIYADEILFASGINPLRKGVSLNKAELKKIAENMIKILQSAIAAGGTTIRSFQSDVDVSGRFQNELKAHMQKTCPKCGSLIAKIKVGGRSTYYCPICQGPAVDK